MAVYPYTPIRKLAVNLEKAGIDRAVIDQIMEGGEEVKAKEDRNIIADWMREAMRRMDTLLDTQTRHTVREGCACCLGAKRYKLSKEIAENYNSLEDRIRAANETHFVFGHSVTMQEDGKILVRFSPDDATDLRCACLPQAKEPLSITYCYCCGGHVKHHLQTALGRSLEVKVLSSILSSGGKRTCKFLFTLKDHC